MRHILPLDVIVAGLLFVGSGLGAFSLYTGMLYPVRLGDAFFEELPAGAHDYSLTIGGECVGQLSYRLGPVGEDVGIEMKGEVRLRFFGELIVATGDATFYFSPLGQFTHSRGGGHLGAVPFQFASTGMGPIDGKLRIGPEGASTLHSAILDGPIELRPVRGGAYRLSGPMLDGLTARAATLSTMAPPGWKVSASPGRCESPTALDITAFAVGLEGIRKKFGLESLTQ